jgi:hypothetical protein
MANWKSSIGRSFIVHQIAAKHEQEIDAPSECIRVFAYESILFSYLYVFHRKPATMTC